MLTIYGVLIVIAGAIFRGAGWFYLAAICTIFGATAAAAFGGATILPAVEASGFIFLYALWILHERTGRSVRIRMGSQQFWLILFVLYAAVTAVVMPRLFSDGSVMAYMNDRASGLAVLPLMPVKPVSTNFTQTLYLVLGVLLTVALAYIVSIRERASLLADAFLVAGALNVVFAAIGFTQQFGAPDLLAVFKNGNYAMMAGSVGGLIRISGCFSETSGWSAYSLGLLAFSQSLWVDGYRPKFSGFVAVATLGFLLISTSGTAYGGLALLLACVYGAFLYRKIRRQSYARDHIYIWALWLGLLALILILLFVPQVVQIVVDFFDTTVGNKLESSSGVERSSWTAQAWSNVISTYGLGTGLGTNISSNFVALLISNTGWFGTLLYVLFMYQSLFGTPSIKRGDAAPDVDWRVIRAGRWGMVGVLSAAVFSARVFDLGVPFFMYAAAAGYYQLVVSKQGVQTLSAFKTRTAA